MKMRTYFLLAALAGFVGSSINPTPVSAYEEELEVVDGEAAAKQQCYHYSWESVTTCSTCSNTCLGGNYKCCTIVS